MMIARAWVKEVKDKQITVVCPMCKRDSTFRRKPTDEGQRIELCQSCGNRIRFSHYNDEIYKGVGEYGGRKMDKNCN